MTTQQGTSIIEVMLAMGIILTGVTGLLTLQSRFAQSDMVLEAKQRSLHLIRQSFDQMQVYADDYPQPHSRGFIGIADNMGAELSSPTPLAQEWLGGPKTERVSRQWQVNSYVLADTKRDGRYDLWLSTDDPKRHQFQSISPRLKWVSMTITVKRPGMSPVLTTLNSVIVPTDNIVPNNIWLVENDVLLRPVYQ